MSGNPYPEVERQIVCVDCLETAHLITQLDEHDDLRPGDILIYRCEACLDRWDIVYDPNGELE